MPFEPATPLPAFGTRVNVRATVEPRYLRWVTERRRDFSLGILSFGTDTEPVDPPVLEDASAVPKGPIGEPLLGSPDVPDKGIHRRLRRFDADTTGIVIGSVLRQEGYYVEGSSSVNPVTGEYDGEEPRLAPARTVRLVQVACQPDGPRGPAKTVLTHPDDISPVLAQKADR